MPDIDFQSSPGSAAEPFFSSIGALLQCHAAASPDRAAIIGPTGAAVSYAELWALTSELLRDLRALGIGPADRLAVMLPRGSENAIVLTAVAASAVCVPVNPDFTADELLRYFSDLRLSALVTRADMSSASRGVAHTLGIPVIEIAPRERAGFVLTGRPIRPAVAAGVATSADDAFILLTSGTASRPKMVPLTQASVCRSAYNAGAVLRLTGEDRLLNVLPLFHAHGLISGVLTALSAGSSVICTSGFDAQGFFACLRELRPSWYTAVPAIHRALLSASEAQADSVSDCSLRVIRSASSSLAPAVLEGLEALFGVPVIETYGMTEGASQIAANPIELRKVGSVGRSAGPEIAIMDEQGGVLPVGARGEIMLRGPTITRGYCDDPAATAAAFRDGWFRTGDLGYLDADGYLFIAGRIKDIINRGGQKVSPEEVEQVLLRHPDVLEAAAFAMPHPRLGEAVAAAIVPKPKARLDADQLRQFAGTQLAGYKVPSVIHLATALPKGASGKIKRSALAETFAAPVNAPAAGASAPRTEAEMQLAGIWAGLLECSEIGVDQDVFALGADSILVTQFLSRVRDQLRVTLSFRDVFDAPTVAALAARLQATSRRRAIAAPGWRAPAAYEVAAPLSFQQQRIHFLADLDPTGCHYNVVEAVRLTGPLDVAALDASIAEISRRHDTLRSTFSERRGRRVQIAQPAPAKLHRIDLGDTPAADREGGVRNEVLQIMRSRADLAQQPPFQAWLFHFADDDHALVVRIHHVATDGWSQRLFWEELGAHYGRHCGLSADRLPPPLIQYRQFVAWQQGWLRTQAAKQQLAYWHAQLEGLTVLPLRTDRPRPVSLSGRGARHALAFTPVLSERIRAFCRAEGVTPFMTLLAAFQGLLYRVTGHADVAVGSLIANRNQVEIERLIGMFANTIVLRTDLSGDPSFRALLARVRTVTIDAYRNQDLPIEEVLRTAPLLRGQDAAPLFRVMFILQNATTTTPTLPGLSVDLIDVDPGLARFDLTLELNDSGEAYAGFFEYSTDLFEAGTIARMAAHLDTLLQAALDDPGAPITQLEMLPASERREVLKLAAGSRIDFGSQGDVLAGLAAQVARMPEAIAVSDAGHRISYRELDASSAAIAGRLISEGLGPEAVVALWGARSPHLLAAMVGVHRAGAAFLCLDPAQPAARLVHMLKDSGAAFILASEGEVAALQPVMDQFATEVQPRIALIDELVTTPPSGGAALPSVAETGLAYVIYTSGSSGWPKGTLIERRGLANHLASVVAAFGLGPGDVVAQTAPQSFVIAVWQCLAGLTVGARIHVCAAEVVRDPVLLAQEIGAHGITVLQIVPSLLRALLEQVEDQAITRALSGLRIVIATGEPLTVDLCRSWLTHFPDIPLVNAYGASECSDDVTLHRMTSAPEPGGVVSIGQSLPNTQVYVLDGQFQPVPIGVVGEICVGGAGVARGYLNDPARTAERFVPDPFSAIAGARLYRTGDLGRRRADGALECLGRMDRQLKIRGHRIELQEIEQVLLDHPLVRHAIVEPHGLAGRDIRLIAHVVPASGGRLTASELRSFIKAKLPGHMIPSAFLFLDRLPLNAHGKVDRAVLRVSPIADVTEGPEPIAPENAIETLVCEIWAEVLKRRRIGATDNFFELGGHSLLAGQVMARLAAALQLSLPMKVLFEAPTVTAFAQRIDQARAQQLQPMQLIPAIARGAGPQASMAQAQMIRMEHALPGLPQFNLPFAFRLVGPIKIDALARGLSDVVRRHDVLRTGFGRGDDEPHAVVIAPDQVPGILSVEDLADGVADDDDRPSQRLRLRAAKLIAQQEAWTPFDVSHAPLLRARLLRLAVDDHVLLITFHHAVVDGWSIGLLLEEISQTCSSLPAPEPLLPPQGKLTFSDVARWQRAWCTTAAADEQMCYWREVLHAATPVFGPGGRGVAARLGARTGHEPVQLTRSLIKRLDAFAKSQNGTLFMGLLTALNAVLMKRTGRQDICIATSMANRVQPATERVVGPLENTVIIRTRLTPDLSFAEAFDRVRRAVLDAHARQELPFNVLAEQLADKDSIDPAGLIQVYFTLQNPLRQPLRLPGVAVNPLGDVAREGQPVLPVNQTWLSLMLKERPTGITGTLGYKTDLFASDDMATWVADFRAILEMAIAGSRTSLAELLDRQAA
ncbi:MULTISPECIES: non-ribosomal peptide synthetase [unclassified Bradyrhizobium]|uniref:non-ribosomal peptide synthetase n=1 Tax=unclassified Bradyrhizobium TaxID=2631580 RepID=UPI0028F10F11|nr:MULTISPECIES: non-ribosomal peptide synthetase [unclassified Bradyrhizobium]